MKTFFRLEDIGLKTPKVKSLKELTRSDLVPENLVNLVKYYKDILGKEVEKPNFIKTRDLFAPNDPTHDNSPVTITQLPGYVFGQTHCYAALSIIDYNYSLILNSIGINTEKITHIKHLRNLFTPSPDDFKAPLLALWDAKEIIENWKQTKAIFGYSGGIPYSSNDIDNYLAKKHLSLNKTSHTWLQHRKIAKDTGYDLFWDMQSVVDLDI